jgi:hypothetical protein
MPRLPRCDRGADCDVTGSGLESSLWSFALIAARSSAGGRDMFTATPFCQMARAAFMPPVEHIPMMKEVITNVIMATNLNVVPGESLSYH